MLGLNVIMAKDFYHTKLYQTKKQYYSERVDLLEKKAIKKGWKAWIDSMAKRWALRLICSHAQEIIAEAEGQTEVVKAIRSHHNYIPPKKANDDENEEILRRVCPKILRGDYSQHWNK